MSELNSAVKAGSVGDDQENNEREAVSKMSAPVAPQRSQFATDPRSTKNNSKLHGSLEQHTQGEAASEHTNAPHTRKAAPGLESEDGICNRQGSQASMTNTGEQEMQMHSPVAETEELRSQAQGTEGGVRVAGDINHDPSSHRNGHNSNIVYNSANRIMSNDPYGQHSPMPRTSNQTPHGVPQGRPTPVGLDSPSPGLPPRHMMDSRGGTVKASNPAQHLSSYDLASNGLCSGRTKAAMQQSEPILQVYSMDKQSEDPTVKYGAGPQGSECGLMSQHTGFKEATSPSAVTDQVGPGGYHDVSAKAFGYEVESSPGHGAIRVSPSRFNQEAYIEDVADNRRNIESHPNLNKRSTHALHFEGESVADEYVDGLMQHTRRKPDKQSQGEQEYAQQLQQCSIGRNSDEDCSQKEQQEILSNDNDLRRKGSNIQTDDSQQQTRSAFEQPNFVQQCTDPSDDKDGKANQDSQQSSAVSQYFRQSETDEMNQEDLLLGPPADSISRQVIMEADEYQYAELLEQQEQQHAHIHLLNQLEIVQPHEIAERDQHEESDSHPAATVDDKGHGEEFSITENDDELPGNMPDIMPSQTDGGLEYSASAHEGPQSFDGRSQIQLQNNNKGSETYGMLEQTPQFVLPSKENSNCEDIQNRDEQYEQNEELGQFELGNNTVGKQTEIIQGEVALEVQPDSIECSTDQFASLNVKNEHPYQQEKHEEEDPVAQRPLNFQNLQVKKRRYSNDGPNNITDDLATNEYGMFDISKGLEDSGEIDPTRDVRAREANQSGMEKRKGTRASSRFSQAACDELEKVAERINMSMELKEVNNSLDDANDLNLELEPINQDQIKKTQQSIKTKKRTSIEPKSIDATKKTQKTKKGKKKSANNSRSHSRGDNSNVKVQDERAENVYQMNASDSQKGTVNIITKEVLPFRKPPEIPALVMAARERAGKLKQGRGSSPFETQYSGKSKFKNSKTETAPLQITENTFPVRLAKRSVIKSPVLTSAQNKHKLNFQFINRKKDKETLSSGCEDDLDKSTQRIPSEEKPKKGKNTSSLTSDRKGKKSGEKELKSPNKKTQEQEQANKSRSARRIVVNNILKSHSLAQKVSPRHGNRIQTANSTGRWFKRGIPNQSIEGSSTAASGFGQTHSNYLAMPRRPLSTDQAIDNPDQNQEYPVTQQLQNKLQNQRNRGGDVSPQINLKYSGITKHDIQGMSIDEIYKRMNNNLVLNDQDFQQRCHNVVQMNSTQNETPIDLRAPKAQYRLLKARLMESDNIANRRVSDITAPSLNMPSMYNSSSINMSQPLQNEALYKQQMPEGVEEITDQKDEPIHLEKGQFILYTTQPISRMPGQMTGTLPNSPAAVSLYQQNPNRIYAFQSAKPQSSYGSRPFRQSNVMTPNSGTSYESFFKQKPIYQQNPALNSNYGQAKSHVNVNSFLPSGKSMSNMQLVNGGMSRTNQRFVSTGRKWNSKEQQATDAHRSDPKKDRASTANNCTRPRGMVEALQPEIMLSNATVGPAFKYSKSNQGLDQNKLQQKLQYRSLRGRKIQEFLAQVKSQKLQQNLLSDNTSVDIMIVKQSESASRQDECFSATNKSNQRISQLYQADKSKAMINSVDESLNQIESNPDIQEVFNTRTVLYPRKESTGFKDTMNSTISSQLNAHRPSTMNDSIILSQFLAQQDKRIDFGSSELFHKVENGEPLDLHAGLDASKVPLTAEELEGLISLVRRNSNAQVQKREFQIRSHDKILETLALLMNELGLGYRLERMQRDENQKNLDRIYVLACRAHKLYKARTALITIFSQIVNLRQDMPIVKKQLLANISDKSKDAKKLKKRRPTAEQIEDLTNQAETLKASISQLVFNIQNLLATYKFFNSSFVLDDKDYLKYLSKETNEMKGLFTVFNVPFE